MFYANIVLFHAPHFLLFHFHLFLLLLHLLLKFHHFFWWAQISWQNEESNSSNKWHNSHTLEHVEWVSRINKLFVINWERLLFIIQIIDNCSCFACVWDVNCCWEEVAPAVWDSEYVCAWRKANISCLVVNSFYFAFATVNVNEGSVVVCARRSVFDCNSNVLLLGKWKRQKEPNELFFLKIPPPWNLWSNWNKFRIMFQNCTKLFFQSNEPIKNHQYNSDIYLININIYTISLLICIIS